MKIEDYKNVVSRMHIKPGLETEIIDSSTEKNNQKRHLKTAVSKRIIVSIVRGTALAICLSTFTIVFVIVGIFRKTNNFKTETNVESSMHEEISYESESAIIPKVTFRKWNVSALKDIFNKNAGDDWQLQYSDGDIRWEYDAWYDYSYNSPTFSFHYRYYGKTIDDVVLEDREINDLDKSECTALADSYIEKLDISVKSKQVYALDLEFLIKSDTARNERGERIDSSGEILPEWTENQEAYLIVYTPCVNDIPISKDDNQINVVVGRNGLAYFEANGIYETVEVDTVEICSAEEAMDAVYKYFGKDQAAVSIDVNKCRLVYKPRQSAGKIYKLNPYWEFNFAEISTLLNLDKGNNEFDYHDTLLVNAQTGELVKR